MEYLERIREHLAAKRSDELKQLFFDMAIDDLMDIWDSFTAKECIEIFLFLDLNQKLVLINALDQAEQEQLISSLSEENAKVLLNEIPPDDLADFIQAVSPEFRKKILNHLSDEAKKEIEFLLTFDEDDAAGLMTPRLLAVRSSLTVSQALEFIRKSVREVETINYIYVIDQIKRLQGVVSIRDILGQEDSRIIGQIMETNIISVREKTDQEEVARILEKSDFMALPVVDRFNRLLGIVTFDDIIDVIHEEQTEDVYKMGAMEGTPDRYLETSILKAVKKRIPWLTILLLAGAITTNVLQLYEQLMIGAAFLLLFIPVITQTGGNTGTQSATLMIRGLATGEIRFRNVGHIVLKELLVGLIMGIAMGIIIMLRSYFLSSGIDVFQAAAVGISLMFVILFSTVLGALIPLIINKIGIDPTVAAGPVMATIIDVCGLTIYFEIAKLLLNLK